MNLNNYIEHTLLKPNATKQEISNLCNEAVKHRFVAVCVPSSYVKFVATYLNNTNIKIVTVVGFPLGYADLASKVFEAQQAIDNGADEIDMVINISYLKSCAYMYVREEIDAIKKVVGKKVLKVIIETCYLTNEEIIVASQIAVNAKADYIKTSTGFGTNGAQLKDVALIKEVICDLALIKASGGIKNLAQTQAFIKAGAKRIGTSSGCYIMYEQQQKKQANASSVI